MNLSSLLRRTFIGRPVPATEDIQQRILRMLEDRVIATTDEIAETLMSDLPDDIRHRELAQAAQILVNQGIVEARAVEGLDAGRTVDPVYTDGPIRLTLLRRDSSIAS